ncbi:MAG: hypothetical protein OEZ06_22525 [Myxococcales bacterium]|nr:hypothetical protein [Myxococcales bacterium]
MGELASVEQEAQALSETVGVRRRDDLRLLQIRGDDRQSWLNGQLTNDVRELAPERAVYALVVDVRGKIVADVWAFQSAMGGASEDGALSLWVPRTQLSDLLEIFEAQIIMEDVELSEAETGGVLSLQGPLADKAAAEILARCPGLERVGCDELGAGGQWLYGSPDALVAAEQTAAAVIAELGGCAVSEAGYELSRLRAGVPRFGVDFDRRHYPQESGLKERAVSFNKGCYIGQEVICTLENRGRLSRRLVRLEGEHRGPFEPAALLDADGETVGELTSGAWDGRRGRALALGYVKSRATATDTPLSYRDATLRVVAMVGL